MLGSENSKEDEMKYECSNEVYQEFFNSYPSSYDVRWQKCNFDERDLTDCNEEYLRLLLDDFEKN